MSHSSAAIILATVVRILPRSYTAVHLATSEVSAAALLSVPAVREAAFGSSAIG
jgi:hypothetical protein